MPTALDIASVRIDGGTQTRAELNRDLVAEYAESVGALPPVTIFYDGSDHWLADGFHRHAAHVAAGESMIRAEVRQGSRRDAILFSVGANACHGLRRTNADKRRAVETLLRDDEWSQWSNREIARQAQVGHPFVAKVRSEVESDSTLAENANDSVRTYQTADGRKAVQSASKPEREPATKQRALVASSPSLSPDPWRDFDRDESFTPATPEEMHARGGAKTMEIAREFAAKETAKRQRDAHVNGSITGDLGHIEPERDLPRPPKSLDRSLLPERYRVHLSDEHEDLYRRFEEIYQRVAMLGRQMSRLEKPASRASFGLSTLSQARTKAYDLGHVATRIEEILPYAVCPYCKGHARIHGRTCKGCTGQGAVSPKGFRDAPGELINSEKLAGDFRLFRDADDNDAFRIANVQEAAE